MNSKENRFQKVLIPTPFYPGKDEGTGSFILRYTIGMCGMLTGIVGTLGLAQEIGILPVDFSHEGFGRHIDDPAIDTILTVVGFLIYWAATRRTYR